LRQVAGEGVDLPDDRRDDDEPDAEDRQPDQSVDEEDRQPARHPPAREEVHGRPERYGEEGRDEHQAHHAAHEIEQVEQCGEARDREEDPGGGTSRGT